MRWEQGVERSLSGGFAADELAGFTEMNYSPRFPAEPLAAFALAWPMRVDLRRRRRAVWTRKGKEPR